VPRWPAQTAFSRDRLYSTQIEISVGQFTVWFMTQGATLFSVNIEVQAGTYEKLFGLLMYLEKWPLFLLFSCYNTQMQYKKEKLT
jgi:hypothetical protein